MCAVHWCCLVPLPFGSRAVACTVSPRRPSANAGLNDISLVKSVQGAALRAAVVCGKEVWSAHGYQISIRDATTGDVKHEMPTDSHHSIVWCFVVVGRYVWAGTSTGPINIYDVRKRTLVKTARYVGRRVSVLHWRRCAHDEVCAVRTATTLEACTRSPPVWTASACSAGPMTSRASCGVVAASS